MTRAIAILALLASAHTAQADTSYDDLICSYFGADCATALRVAQCESRMDPWARGALGEVGLFQVHPIHSARVGGDLSRLYDAETNIRIARDLHAESGWSPWRGCL